MQGALIVFAGELTISWLISFTGIAVVCARLYLGVHFPFDMLGSVLAAVTAYLSCVHYGKNGGRP